MVVWRGWAVVNTSVKKPRLDHLVLILLALLWTAFFVARYAYSLYDDAYIYLRYVQNVLGGCGLRFNCGEAPVEGFTSPLYLGLLVLGGLVGFGEDLETLTQMFGLVGVATALTAAGLSAGWLAREAWPDRPLLERWALPLSVVLLLGAAKHFMLNSVIGLETALGCVVVTCILASALRKDDLPAMRSLLVLAVLTRPETTLFIPAVLIFPKARQWRYWLPLLGSLLAVALWRYTVFADFVPNTYWAKSGGTIEHLRLGVEYLALLAYDFPVILLAPLALLHPGTRRSVGFFGSVALLWCAFFLKSGGDTFAYSRLAVPLVPGLSALAVFGVLVALDKLQQRLSSTHRAALPAVAITLAALGAAHGYLAYDIANTQHGFDNVQRWTKVGQFLRQNHPDATLATVPIGAISYFSQSPRVIDLVGLTSREVAKAGRTVPPERLGRHWIGHERHNTEWVIEQAPDLIIFNKWASQPLPDPSMARAGFYSDWLLLRAIKEGRIPYVLYMPQVAPELYWQMFVRRDLLEPAKP